MGPSIFHHIIRVINRNAFFADMRNNIRQIVHQTWSAFHAKKWIHTGCCVKAMNLNCKCAFKADYHNWKRQQQYRIILLNSFSFSLSYQSSGKHHDCRFYFGGIRPRQDKKNYWWRWHEPGLQRLNMSCNDEQGSIHDGQLKGFNQSQNKTKQKKECQSFTYLWKYKFSRNNCNCFQLFESECESIDAINKFMH